MALQEEKRLSLRLRPQQPETSLSGRPLRFGTKKQLALLCYLAAEGEAPSGGSLPSSCGPTFPPFCTFHRSLL
jgi:hypothetical protein